MLQNIRQEIAKANLEKAIQLLKESDLDSKGNHLKRLIEQIESRYNHYNQRLIKGLLSNEENQKTHNEITDSLINLCNLIDKNLNNNTSTTSSNAKIFLSLNTKPILIVWLSTLGIFLFLITTKSNHANANVILSTEKLEWRQLDDKSLFNGEMFREVQFQDFTNISTNIDSLQVDFNNDGIIDDSIIFNQETTLIADVGSSLLIKDVRIGNLFIPDSSLSIIESVNNQDINLTISTAVEKNLLSNLYLPDDLKIFSSGNLVSNRPAFYGQDFYATATISKTSPNLSLESTGLLKATLRTKETLDLNNFGVKFKGIQFNKQDRTAGGRVSKSAIVGGQLEILENKTTHELRMGDSLAITPLHFATINKLSLDSSAIKLEVSGSFSSIYLKSNLLESSIMPSKLQFYWKHNPILIILLSSIPIILSISLLNIKYNYV